MGVVCVCGGGSIAVQCMLHSSPDPRRRQVRSNIRQTWFNLINTSSSVTVDLRFVLMFDVDAVPQTILVEAAEFGDILIVHPSRSSPSEHPFSLLPKVLQFFRWATDACVSATHILKTNEHSFVHVSRLQAELVRSARVCSNLRMPRVCAIVRSATLTLVPRLGSSRSRWR